MRHSARDWLLAREKDAEPRLDSIRRAALAPRRATFLDCALEVFRPNLGAWAALALVWILLAVAEASIPRRPPAGMPRAMLRAESAFFVITAHEKIPALDSPN
jgi:hypothetical protein